jgi:hypothetical protein
MVLVTAGREVNLSSPSAAQIEHYPRIVPEDALLQSAVTVVAAG